MQDSQSSPVSAKPSRRSFFAGAATVGVALGATAVLPRTEDPVEASTGAPSKPAPDKGGGYHLSDHVKHYYRTTSA